MSNEDNTIKQYQKMCQDMVAPASQKGTHFRGYTDYRSEPPRMSEKGMPVHKYLRKATQRLNDRIVDYTRTINDHRNTGATGYRKPGSMSQ